MSYNDIIQEQSLFFYQMEIEKRQAECVERFYLTLEDRLKLDFFKRQDTLAKIKGKIHGLCPKVDIEVVNESLVLVINPPNRQTCLIARKKLSPYLYTENFDGAIFGCATSGAATKIGNSWNHFFPYGFEKERPFYNKEILFDPLVEQFEPAILLHISNSKELSALSRRTTRKLFNLYRLSVYIAFNSFSDHLDQDVVAAMRQTQFTGTVYYNWLLGAPRAHVPGDAMATPDPKLAKGRQAWAIAHPQAANILAHVLTFNDSSVNNNDRPNEQFFSHEAVYGVVLDGEYLEKRLYTMIGRGIHLALLTPDKMSPHILNPRFWRGAEGDFNEILNGFIQKDTGRMPTGTSFIEPLATVIQTQTRMRTHRPRLIPGGAL